MARNETYEEFVEKFKPKKTTDDCYTPGNVYNAVADWVSSEYSVDRRSFVRPFWPGGDFEAFDYPEECVVVDNPPFSIMARILRFYRDRGIRFFLFAPALTLFNYRSIGDFLFIVCGADVTYDNGANVSTSFVTNLAGGGFWTAPELRHVIDGVNAGNLKTIHVVHEKYVYPDNVVSSAILMRYAKYGVDLYVPSSEYMPITRLDSQIASKKTIYGKGLLLSEKAAAEKAAAEKAAADKAGATVWTLSDRERELIRSLGK